MWALTFWNWKSWLMCGKFSMMPSHVSKLCVPIHLLEINLFVAIMLLYYIIGAIMYICIIKTYVYVIGIP